MNKRAGYEFIATIGKDGTYECHETPTIFPIEPMTENLHESDHKLQVEEKIKGQTDVNKVFFESYNSNFTMGTNELLKQAQKNLMDMQKIILDNLKP